MYVEFEGGFQKLFTYMNTSNQPRVLGENNDRWISSPVNEVHNKSTSWNSVSFQLADILKDIGITKSCLMKMKDQEFKFEFSLLRSDAGLDDPQQIHTDEMTPYQYSSIVKVFHMVLMIGVEENGFIN